jgi:anti-anti-sigma factor
MFNTAPRPPPREGVTVVRFPDKVLGAEGVRAVARSLDGSAGREVSLDLGGVEFPTAGGLGALVALQKRLRAAGGRLSLRNVGGLVYEAFEVTRLTGVLGVGPKGPGAG